MYTQTAKAKINLLSLLRELDTLASLSDIFHKGDNFCDFLFAFLNT